jgi:hypothetical protein
MTGKRWMLSVLRAAGEVAVAMPWCRGARRAASIVRRKESAKAKLAGA